MKWTGTLIALGCLVALAFSSASFEEETALRVGTVEIVPASAASAVKPTRTPTLAVRRPPTELAPPQAAPQVAAPPVAAKVLRGRVTDPGGYGVARIAVRIQFSSRRRRAPVTCMVETGPDGAFETPVPARASTALVWARGTERWVAPPGITATNWGLLLWHTARGEAVMRDAKGRPWKPANQTLGIWPEVELRVRPARTLRGQIVPPETDAHGQDLRVLVRASWPDRRHVECTTSVRANADGTFALCVPSDASLLDVGIPVRTWDEWQDERTDVADALCEQGAADEAIEAAYTSVRKPHPGFWLTPRLAERDHVVLPLLASHEVAYAVSVDGRPAEPGEVLISMSLVREEGGGGGLDVRPRCTLSGASCLAAGRYHVTVRSVAKADGVPLFSGSAQADVPGPAVAVDCRQP